ncbi:MULTISPECIES: response regulator transcription factor [Microbacterium]|uniref:response regulator transcription factor n=1 Tax=Microbacterium TaxID=33882 RepID=UPI001E414F00|nr:response regulator transcription factor [Microbacterium nymphoidis]MCD2497110.1 response regulator transcription factor [Microbacterium nymphoidis]
MTEPTVLLVDDEEPIRATLAPYLERSGFRVRTAADGEEALAALAAERTDIIVSDVIMPRRDGRSLLRELRGREDWTPFILLTRVDQAFERSAALDEGADDYLGKPFDPPELVSRIRAVLRRARPGERSLASAQVLRAGELEFDRTARRVRLRGRDVVLTPRATTLLEYLMSHPDELHTRDRLLATLWGYEFAVTTRAIDHRIAEIRRVLGDDPQEPRYIETVQASGYRFVGAVSGS